MPNFVHVTTPVVTGPLEPRGQRPGADSGDPQISTRPFEGPADVRAGIWEAEPGGWPVVDREDTETCYIVSGKATITDGATGKSFDVSAGDVIIQPKGWSGRWDVTETIRKVYSIGVPDAE